MPYWSVVIYTLPILPAALLLRLLAKIQKAEDRYAANPAGLAHRELGLARRGRRVVWGFMLLLAGHAALSLLRPPGESWLRALLVTVGFIATVLILATTARRHPTALFSPATVARFPRLFPASAPSPNTK